MQCYTFCKMYKRYYLSFKGFRVTTFIIEWLQPVLVRPYSTAGRSHHNINVSYIYIYIYKTFLREGDGMRESLMRSFHICLSTSFAVAVFQHNGHINPLAEQADAQKTHTIFHSQTHESVILSERQCQAEPFLILFSMMKAKHLLDW